MGHDNLVATLLDMELADRLTSTATSDVEHDVHLMKTKLTLAGKNPDYFFQHIVSQMQLQQSEIAQLKDGLSRLICALEMQSANSRDQGSNLSAEIYNIKSSLGIY